MRHALREKRSVRNYEKHAAFQVPDWSIFSEELIAYKQLNGFPAATIDIEQQRYVWNFNEKECTNRILYFIRKVLANVHSLPQQKFNNIGALKFYG
ncbi:hypothetical protein ACT7DL_20795 [Bacillus paranthracis]